jgi:RNA polymerase sigma-70 factor (ECF subfamily)
MTVSDGGDTFAQWCIRLAASDTDALDELFDAMHDRLLAFGVSLVGDVAVARDLVQETFIRTWERRATLDASLSLRALMFRTLKNLASNHRRDARTRDRLLAQEGAVTMPNALQPDEVLLANELDARLRQWVDELPDRQREALVLSRYQGLSHAEVADVMAITPITVNNHLVKALATLRARLLASDGEPIGRSA